MLLVLKVEVGNMACSLPLSLSSPIFSTLHTVAAYLPSQHRIEKGNYLTRYILKHGTIGISHSLTHSLSLSLSSADVNDIPAYIARVSLQKKT